MIPRVHPVREVAPRPLAVQARVKPGECDGRGSGPHQVREQARPWPAGSSGPGRRLSAWPRRRVVVALAALSCLIGYTDRTNIGVAAVAMARDLGWSDTQKGLVLSSFFVGYMLMMPLTGWLATRFGGALILGLSGVLWSVFTLLTPAAAALPLPYLIAARVGMGIGESAMFPAAYELFGRWVPAAERARAIARLLSGVPLGTIAGLAATGWIITRYGWPTSFYLAGCVGLVWAAVWFWQVRDDPARDARLSAEERRLLPAGGQPAALERATPWRRLLLRVPVFGIVVGHFALTWNLYVLLSWLPSYFHKVHGVGIASAGILSAAPWLAMFAVTNVAAAVSDRLIARGVSVTAVRKLMQCTGLGVPAVCLLLLRDVSSPEVATALICVAAGALGCCWCGSSPSMLDVAPRHGGIVSGVVNGIATIPGIVGVSLTGWLVDVTGTYAAAFVLTAAVGIVGALVFAAFFDARPLVD